MKKESYNKPISNIEEFNSIEIITTSTGGGYTDNETEVGGDVGDIW